MMVAIQPFMVANAPLPTLAGRYNDIQGVGTHPGPAWGIPARKWAWCLPWFGFEFNCSSNPECPALRGP